jgi:hypothetical protein
MLKTIFKSFIFPSGKVNEKYLSFIRWSFVSNIIMSIENVLGTHSSLSVLGKSSTELTLSTNFIGKDIIGQVGSLLYMNKIGKNADKDPKKFIKYSMIIQQSAVFLESTTPLLPIQMFIPLAGFSNIMMNISFTSCGAINAKIIPLLAKDNIGEMYSKLTIINTISSSIGMGLGLCIVGIIPEHEKRIFILPILSILRIYTYNKSVKDLI